MCLAILGNLEGEVRCGYVYSMIFSKNKLLLKITSPSKPEYTIVIIINYKELWNGEWIKARLDCNSAPYLSTTDSIMEMPFRP